MNPFIPRAEYKRTPVLAQAPTPSGTGSVSLRLYDPIDDWGGDWGVSAKEFNSALDALPDGTTEIRLLINSPGGMVYEGIAIMNALRAHPARIVAVVEGVAASAASFIAAAADEVVMMRNSELFIHNAWGMAIGDAADMRDSADSLEHFDRNIASVYAAKSGKPVDYWLAEMHKDRFLSADEAVSEGLADRIEGEVAEGSARARFDLTAYARRVPAPTAPAAALPELPDSSEPGANNRKESVMAYDDLKAGLRERLGVTDAEASDEQFLAAVDSLAKKAEVTAPPTIPEGVTVIDSAVLAELQASAKQGVEARQEQARQRREGILASALAEGRIAPSSRDSFAKLLEENEESTKALLESFPKNTVPVNELGHSEAEASADDAVYNALFGADKN